MSSRQNSSLPASEESLQELNTPTDEIDNLGSPAMKGDRKGKERERKHHKKLQTQKWIQMNNLPKKEQLISRRKEVYDMLFKGD